MGYIRFRLRVWLHQTRTALTWKLAYLLPRSIALIAFVRVYSVIGDCGDDYSRAYIAFERGEGK